MWRPEVERGVGSGMLRGGAFRLLEEEGEISPWDWGCGLGVKGCGCIRTSLLVLVGAGCGFSGQEGGDGHERET